MGTSQSRKTIDMEMKKKMVNKGLLGWAETMDTERNFNKRQFTRFLPIYRGSLKAQLVKNLPAMQEIPVQFLGRKDLL